MGCGPVRILSAVSCLSRGRSVAKKKEKWGPSIGEKFRFRESPVRFSKRIRLDDERVDCLFVYSISFCLCLNDRSHSIRYRLIVELGEWGLSQSNLRTLRCFRAAKREKKNFFQQQPRMANGTSSTVATPCWTLWRDNIGFLCDCITVLSGFTAFLCIMINVPKAKLLAVQTPVFFLNRV